MFFLRRTTPCFALLAVLLCATVDAQEAVTVPNDAPQFHLFLLAGQSNMAGRGSIAEEDLVPHPRVLMLAKDETWVPAIDPLHFDKPNIVGVGIGKTFAIDYAEANPEITVGLIPCAVGGSPIAAWQPGGYHRQTESHPYDDAIRRTTLALKAGTLKGILWHQGESDSNPTASSVYEQKLHELISRFRREFHAPDVPFIAGQLGQFAERPWNDDRRRVDAAHRGLPSKVPRTAFAGSDGLVHRGDETHFDAASYRELGHRFFNSYLTITQPGGE